MTTETKTKTITIDWTDIESMQEAVQAGLTTPKQLHEWSGHKGEMVENCLVVDLDIWYADHGNGEVGGSFNDGKSAAQNYVNEGDWGGGSSTVWVEVSVWREGIDRDGDMMGVDEYTHTITIEAKPPKCHEGGEHKWTFPQRLVGGIKESPGCYGHGGGMVCNSVCLQCGCGRADDLWEPNPSNGKQGFHAVKYTEGEYVNSLEAIAQECGEKIGREIAVAMLDLLDEGEKPDEWPGLAEEHPSQISAIIQGIFRESVEQYAEVAYDEEISNHINTV